MKFSKLDKDEQQLDEMFAFAHKLSAEKLANYIKEKQAAASIECFHFPWTRDERQQNKEQEIAKKS